MQLAGPTICTSCKNLSKKLNPDLMIATTCTAFPDGIPGQYLSGGAPHLESDGRDGGIVYEFDGVNHEQLETYLTHHPSLVAKLRQ